MLVELGHFALIMAFCVALVQAVVPMVGAHRRQAAWMALAEPAAITQVILIGFAFAVLTHAFVTSDFSLRLVVANSHTDKPMLYKISGVWGNHEGSMLLWVLILALFGASAAVFGGNLPDTLRARVLAVQGAIGVAFLAFILFTSNPFLRMDAAANEWRGSEPAVAGSRLGVSSAVSLPWLCRPFDVVQLCRRGADRGTGRCRLGALGAALDAGCLGVSDRRHRSGIVVGLLRAWAGAGSGSGIRSRTPVSCRG